MGTHREYKQEVRDALYGFVYRNRAEWDIINSPAFQGGMSSRIWRGRVYANLPSRDEVHKFCDQWLQGHPLQATTGGT